MSMAWPHLDARGKVPSLTGAGCGEAQQLILRSPRRRSPPVRCPCAPTSWKRATAACPRTRTTTLTRSRHPRRAPRSRHKNFCARRRKSRPKKYKKGGYQYCRACDEKRRGVPKDERTHKGCVRIEGCMTKLYAKRGAGAPTSTRWGWGRPPGRRLGSAGGVGAGHVKRAARACAARAPVPRETAPACPDLEVHSRCGNRRLCAQEPVAAGAVGSTTPSSSTPTALAGADPSEARLALETATTAARVSCNAAAAFCSSANPPRAPHLPAAHSRRARAIPHARAPARRATATPRPARHVRRFPRHATSSALLCHTDFPAAAGLLDDGEEGAAEDDDESELDDAGLLDAPGFLPPAPPPPPPPARRPQLLRRERSCAVSLTEVPSAVFEAVRELTGQLWCVSRVTEEID